MRNRYDWKRPPGFMSRRRTLVPFLALAFASAVCLGLLGARVVVSRSSQHLYLVWNLFLAWLPLLFAGALWRLCQRGEGRGWRFFGLAGAWLLFLPNAPYICTDLMHLGWWRHSIYWVDLVVILLFAWTGLLLGFLSLYLMHSMMRRRYGVVTGWTFVAGVAGLCGVGIYFGRFLRWNSWEVLVHPLEVLSSFGRWASDPLANPKSAVLAALFATFLFVAYLTLHALVNFRPALAIAARRAAGDLAETQAPSAQR